jgi:alpha-maltose-1-phosphate synthase
MRIAFLPEEPITGRRICRDQLVHDALAEHGHELTIIHPGRVERSPLQQRVGWRLRGIGINYRDERSPYVLKHAAERIELELAHGDFDLIFSMSTLHVAYLRTKLPVVTWSDAVFDCIVDFYDSHKRMDPLSIYQGHSAEERALQRADVSVFTSTWAANAAARRYRFPLNRIRVVNRGPNLNCVPSAEKVLNKGEQPTAKLTALVVGVNWERKGGATAWEAIRILRDRGYSANLVTIGMEPSPNLKDCEGLRTIPLLSKEDSADWEEFRRAFLEADLLLLPSRADFTPNVINEAYTFGLPVIAAAVGGIPEMVDHGVTGYLVDDGMNAGRYAHYLERLIVEPELLADMRMAARAKYENDLSLAQAARKLSTIFHFVIESRPGCCDQACTA